jgi:hypothetical protein
MDRPSDKLADRFGLKLEPAWKQWFDFQSRNLVLPGRFCHPVNIDELCQQSPQVLWPGFMQPDSLPLVGNDYGDWICARVTEDNRLGELIHWFHGGGDWIPVGHSIAEALLHDAIDQFRPIKKQMLRGAVESIPLKNDADCLQGSKQKTEFLRWLENSLSESNVKKQLGSILELTEPEDYPKALRNLIDDGLLVEACSCDLIESIINKSLPNDKEQSIKNLSSQEWSEIEWLCEKIIRMRSDIGWSFALHGMSCEFRFAHERAQSSWFQGRFASAFSDQSVRLQLHHFEKHYKKCCIAQLVSKPSQLPDKIRNDGYLEQFTSSDANCLNSTIQNFWRQQGCEAMNQERFAEAYQAFYRSGWDLGAEKLMAFHQILTDMREAAAQAGWVARSRVIQSYLECL